MKLINVIRAKAALERLTEKRFTNYKIARQLVILRKKVESDVEFYADQQLKAVRSYAELNNDGTPVFIDEQRIKLKDENSKVEFESAMIALNDTDIDDFDVITLTESDFCSQNDIPSPSDMLALEGLVEFVD